MAEDTPTVVTEPTPESEEFKAITSQADLDRIIGERLARERKKIADYGDLDALKAAADELEAIKAASQTELEKALARAEKAEKSLNELQQASQIEA